MKAIHYSYHSHHHHTTASNNKKINTKSTVMKVIDTKSSPYIWMYEYSLFWVWIAGCSNLRTHKYHLISKKRNGYFWCWLNLLCHSVWRSKMLFNSSKNLWLFFESFDAKKTLVFSKGKNLPWNPHQLARTWDSSSGRLTARRFKPTPSPPSVWTTRIIKSVYNLRSKKNLSTRFLKANSLVTDFDVCCCCCWNSYNTRPKFHF